MDSSYLSDAGIIEASRDFVCIRTATYENAEEAEFLKKIYRGRSPDLENTVFALMDPAADKLLSRSGRAPNFAYRSTGQMVDAMELISMAYPGNEKRADRLPQMEEFRVALNVASCDGLPLVVGYSKKSSQQKEISDKLVPMAFDSALAGKYQFYVSSNAEEFSKIEGFDSAAGIFIVEPGEFGLTGSVYEKLSADLQSAELQKKLLDIATNGSKVNKDYRRHMRSGINAGIMWQSKIPVTDPGSVKAMERRKGK